MRKILLKILNFIRRILAVLKRHCLPTPLPLSPYEMFKQEEIKKCFETFKPHFKKSIFLEYKNYHKFIIKRAKENDLLNKKFFLEFGVHVGTTINFFSNYVNKIYGFDSFEGLREDWYGTTSPKGRFNLNKKLPN